MRAGVSLRERGGGLKITATLDGILYALGSRIEKMLEPSITLPTSSAGTDGRANHMPPDANNF